MFRFFVSEDQMDEGRGLVLIGGPDVNHIRNVLRMFNITAPERM